MPRDAVPKTVETVVVSASSPAINPPQNPPQADLVLAAAVETGKAQQAAETAATRAESAAASAASQNPALLVAIRREIAELAETVGSLQQVVEAEKSDEDDTLPLAPASVVAIDVPPEEKKSLPSIPTMAPKKEVQKPPKRGNDMLRRVFLGR